MLVSKFYELSNSYEQFDTETETWYNNYGQELRNPEEYNPYSEGYTPFGDE